MVPFIIHFITSWNIWMNARLGGEIFTCVTCFQPFGIVVMTQLTKTLALKWKITIHINSTTFLSELDLTLTFFKACVQLFSVLVSSIYLLSNKAIDILQQPSLSCRLHFLKKRTQVRALLNTHQFCLNSLNLWDNLFIYLSNVLLRNDCINIFYTC